MNSAMIGTDEIAGPPTKAPADPHARGPRSASVGGFDPATAYGVQRVRRREAGPLAGWKLGVTSRAKQAQVGVHEPVRGHLAAADALDLGSPLVVAEHIQPRCEPEIVFIMGADLSGPSVTSSAVLAATAAVAVGIEVLDSRYTGYKFTMPDVVADNTSAGRYVGGSALPGGPSGRCHTPGARRRSSRFPATWLSPTARARTRAGRWPKGWSATAWSPARGTGTATSWPPGGAGPRPATSCASSRSCWSA